MIPRIILEHTHFLEALKIVGEDLRALSSLKRTELQAKKIAQNTKEIQTDPLTLEMFLDIEDPSPAENPITRGSDSPVVEGTISPIPDSAKETPASATTAPRELSPPSTALLSIRIASAFLLGVGCTLKATGHAYAPSLKSLAMMTVASAGSCSIEKIPSSRKDCVAIAKTCTQKYGPVVAEKFAKHPFLYSAMIATGVFAAGMRFSLSSKK